jgi:hypothetical protein
VKKCTGVSILEEQYSKWTTNNLSIGDVSGVNTVLVPDVMGMICPSASHSMMKASFYRNVSFAAYVMIDIGIRILDRSPETDAVDSEDV